MAENKGKYQPWCHEEFMADRKVRRMSPTAVKTYMMLLHEAFFCSTRPHLPDDEEEIKLMAFCETDEEWLSVRDEVLGMFSKETVDGRRVLVNKRLVKDWKHLQEIREARSEAGKSSAAKRKATSVEQVLTSVDICQQVSKEVKEEREDKEESENPSLSLEDGQGDEMKIKKELQAVCAGFGVKAGGYQSTWEEVQALAVVHSVGAVVRDFEEWMQEYQGDDFPQGAVSKYLHVAAARLGADSVGSGASAKSPEVVSLARELAYVSDGVLSFGDKHRIRLAEVLKEFSADEILSAFKIWIGDQDLNDTKNVQFLPGKFVHIADGLCYSAKRKKQETEQAKSARDAAVIRLQEEAEAERKRQEEEAAKEDSIFDPLA